MARIPFPPVPKVPKLCVKRRPDYLSPTTFGATKAGEEFLHNVGASSRIRLSEPSEINIAAANAGIWTKVLGGSVGSSVAAGLFAAAIGFFAEGLGRMSANRGKTADQVEQEEGIALLLKSYSDGEKRLKQKQDWIFVIWCFMMLAFMVWECGS